MMVFPLSWLFNPILSVLSPKHDLFLQGPNRQPPDPELFPNHIMNKQGIWLHWRSWFPASGVIKGVVVVCHGLGDHHARWEGNAAWLNQHGYAVFILEHQGHGASEGTRKYCERFQHYVDDQELFLMDVVRKGHPQLAGKPFFLIGFSMGGLIGAHLAHRTQDVWTGVILYGPALKADPRTAAPWMKAAAHVFGRILPKLNVATLDPYGYSQNPQVASAWLQDPLVNIFLRLKARWGSELMKAQDEIFTKVAPAFRVPLLIVHGEEDKFCNLGGSREFIGSILTQDKQLVTFKRAYHELLSEPPEIRIRVKAAVLKFLEGHVSPS